MNKKCLECKKEVVNIKENGLCLSCYRGIKNKHLNITRSCPKCQKTIYHKNKYNRNQSIKDKKLCIDCGKIENSKKVQGKNNPFYGKKLSKESIQKGVENRKKIEHIWKTKEFKEKMSKVTSGKKNGMYGKTFYDVWVEKYGKKEADKKLKAFKEKQSKINSGKNNSMYGKPSPQGSGNGWSGWYKNIFFRSLRELSFIIEDLEPNDLKWESAELKKYSIPYIDALGNKRNYFADFIIDNKRMIDIKPKKLWDTPNNKLKKEAAEKFCADRDMAFEFLDKGLTSFEKFAIMHQKGDLIFTDKYEKKFKEWRK